MTDRAKSTSVRPERFLVPRPSPTLKLSSRVRVPHPHPANTTPGPLWLAAWSARIFPFAHSPHSMGRGVVYANVPQSGALGENRANPTARLVDTG